MYPFGLNKARNREKLEIVTEGPLAAYANRLFAGKACDCIIDGLDYENLEVATYNKAAGEWAFDPEIPIGTKITFKYQR